MKSVEEPSFIVYRARLKRPSFWSLLIVVGFLFLLQFKALFSVVVFVLLLVAFIVDYPFYRDRYQTLKRGKRVIQTRIEGISIYQLEK